MRAILLAGGYGTRLRPLTSSVPKCLVEVGGIPILEHWLRKLEKLNCDSVLINSHYLSEQVEYFLKKYSSKMNIELTYEEELLGTAGTLIHNIDFFKDETGLLIHADNFTTNSLEMFIKSHTLRPKQSILTMLTFNTEYPENCGIVKTNSDGVVEEFYEKSNEKHGNKANGALYIFDKLFLDWVIKYNYFAKDFSLDILPNLIGKVFTYHLNDLYVDIGTPESLQKLNNFLKDK